MEFKDFTEAEEKLFRGRVKAGYPATELAYIFRILEGEKELLKFVNVDNLNLVKEVLENKK